MSDPIFVFPSGAFSYDCPSCGYRCCKSAGLWLEPNELADLTRLRPTLPIFAGGGSAPYQDALRVHQRQPDCWFLETDGRCEIQHALGRPAKPRLCRLFPFQVVGWIETRPVVDLSTSGLCPIRVSTAPDPVSQHHEIARDLTGLRPGHEPPSLALAAAERGLDRAREEAQNAWQQGCSTLSTQVTADRLDVPAPTLDASTALTISILAPSILRIAAGEMAKLVDHGEDPSPRLQRWLEATAFVVATMDDTARRPAEIRGILPLIHHEWRWLDLIAHLDRTPQPRHSEATPIRATTADPQASTLAALLRRPRQAPLVELCRAAGASRGIEVLRLLRDIAPSLPAIDWL